MFDRNAWNHLSVQMNDVEQQYLKQFNYVWINDFC